MVLLCNEKQEVETMSTPHNQACKGDIAKNVLMPGDPLRAKFIAENFLENPRLVNEVRAAYAYTGMYRGKEVSVMASGMGMPSMGIYSYELFSIYDVNNIIRIGSSGAYVTDLNLYDVVLAESVWSESSFARTQNGSSDDILYPSRELNDRILEMAKKLGYLLTPTRVHSSDVFYCEANMDDYREINRKHQCTCVDMESFALFHNAKVLNKNAACLLTISDSFPTGEKASAKERQESFTTMMKIALEACV
jgi:purine-nucleoside phosphorylase